MSLLLIDKEKFVEELRHTVKGIGESSEALTGFKMALLAVIDAVEHAETSSAPCPGEMPEGGFLTLSDVT